MSKAIRTVMTRSALLIALTSIFIAGCAEDPDSSGAINRVQANYVEKSYFTGEWYYQATATEIPLGDASLILGEPVGDMTRIRWDIQEDVLYGRVSFEAFEGAENSPNVEVDENYLGEPVVAFRITKHFDIQQQYNAATGERSNVIYEDTSDRVWWERDYMRVDWSDNILTHHMLDAEPIGYYPQGDDPNAPVFEEDGSYFDVTSRIIAGAEMVDYPPYGTFPACWFYDTIFKPCTPAEYTIRHSFLKIDPEHQYHPEPYKGAATELFGFFWTDRTVYDYQEGLRQQRLERYMNRHNMWATWYDDDGNLLPASEREFQPIVYHVNDEWPTPESGDQLYDIGIEVGDQWNEAFTYAVEAELGSDLPTDARTGEKTRVFVFCPHNPVREGDHPDCGPVGTAVRLGDLRYSYFAYIPQFMDYGLLGYGPSNADPLTGEIINGTAYVYHWNNTAARRTADQIRLLNGDLATDEFIEGLNLEDWRGLVNSQNPFENRYHDLEEAEYMVEQVANNAASRYWDGRRVELTEEHIQQIEDVGVRRFLTPYIDRMYEAGFANGERIATDTRLRSIQGSYIEDLMVTNDLLIGMGLDPNDSRASLIENASVARDNFRQRTHLAGLARSEYQMANNMYAMEMADDALMAYAREWQGNSADEVYDDVRALIYRAVVAHEVGHTIGLMHNFGGSDDAVNYKPEYWELRAADGTPAPRTIDPITEDEINGKIYDYAYTSIMDYAGRYVIDGAGVGEYDRAALLFGYSQMLEFYEDDGGIDRSLLASWAEDDGDVLQLFLFGPSAVHYTYFYNEMGDLMTDRANRILLPIEAATDRTYAEGIDADGVSRARVPYIYCSHGRSDLGDSCLTRDFGADPGERMKNMLDDLNTWYITRAFPRGSISSQLNDGYVSRYYRRIYDRMANWVNLYALYSDLLPQFYGASQLEAFYADPTNGWGQQTWAVQNSFNYLMQTILMPDANESYGMVEQLDGTQLMEPFSGNIDLGVDQARYYSTSWSFSGDVSECGYFWSDCLHHFGFYLDKVMSLYALTQSETNFVARATPEDIREWNVGYYTIFPEQIERLNAAIGSQDWSYVGPSYNASTGEIDFPNYTGRLDQERGNLIDPAADFTLMLYMQVLGQARFVGNYDASFMEDAGVYVMGVANMPQFDEITTFQDPFSGYTYAAPVRTGIASGEAMIARANEILAMSSYCDSTFETAMVEDDCINGTEDDFRADYELGQYVEWLQAVADITNMMDGQRDYGDPYNP